MARNENDTKTSPIEKVNPYKDTVTENTFEGFVQTFATNLYKTLSKITNNQYYNPLYANSLVKDTNMHPHKPTMSQLKTWLDNPQVHEKELKDMGLYLENTVMQYKRSIYQFGTILNFNYYLYPLDKVPKDAPSIKTYQNSKDKANLWLQKFRPKEQFSKALLSTMEEGGKFYYIRESDKYIDLAEMPSDWAYIDGRSSVGFTYSFNMTYFLKMPDSLDYFAPEFTEWYKDFLTEQRKSNCQSYYKRMPVEKAVVFTFDDIHAEIVPPLSSVFSDALQIQEYKAILKSKTQLANYQMLMQEIPKDEEGNPTIDPILASQFVALVQAVLPPGVVTASSPMKTESIKFSDTQTQNNINGLGESNYWKGIGIAGAQFGMDSNSAVAMKYSNTADYLFVKNFYNQCTRLVNYQLSLVTGQYNFGVKFFGNSFTEAEEIDEQLKVAQYGMPKKKLIASLGYEPFEYQNLLDDEALEGLNEKLIPLMSSHTMDSGDANGAPNKGNDISDAGDATNAGGYNEGEK